MPRIESGTGERTKGVSGKKQVVADRIADEILQATEWRPESVRAVFTLKDDPKKEVSWPVVIEQPELRPFSSKVPQGEAALRRELKGKLDTRPRWAEVRNNFIQCFLAPPGTHVGTLHEFYQYTKKDGSGVLRCWIHLITKKGLWTSFTTPYPDFECLKGEAPEADWLGPEKQLNSGKGPFPYLVKLGLDWKRWTDIELEQAPALWDGHFDTDLAPITPYFQNMDDLTPEILAATRSHGLKPVQWEIIPDDSDYQLSITKDGMFFALTPIIVEGSQEDKAFQDARDVFLELWENFSRVLLDTPTLQFSAEDGKPTDEVKPVIKSVMVPIVRKYPALVKLFRDGVPTISIPVKREDWRTNGLAVLGFVAERLMGEQELFQIVNYEAGAFGDSTDLLAWAAENVPELADDMTVDEGEEF